MTPARLNPSCWDQVTLDLPGATMPVVIAGDGQAVVGLRFGPAERHRDWLADAPRDPDDPVLRRAARELADYASGRRESFGVPLRFRGSEFQVAVWAALRDVPYGTTTTYGALGGLLGRSGRAARAVGAAVGANPIGIIIPCHRVIGADGSLTGFAGGLANKVALLAREGVTALLS